MDALLLEGGDVLLLEDGSRFLQERLVANPSSYVNTPTFGSPTVSPGAVTATPASINNTATVGNITITAGAVTVAPASVASNVTLGALTIGSVATTNPASLENIAAFGTPTLTLSDVVYPTTISSGSQVGSVAATAGTVTVYPSSISVQVGSSIVFELETGRLVWQNGTIGLLL